MSSNPLPPEEREHLAAEYALGLIEGEQLALARALERDDPAFRDDVARWAGRMAPLLDEIGPVPPPTGTLAAIERQISPAQSSGSNVVHLRRQLNRWRVATGTATALAASMALVLLVRPPGETLPPPAPAPVSQPMVALISSEDSAAKIVATWNGGDRSLMVVPAVVPPADAGHSHELWLIPADGTPRSMGVLPSGGPLRMTVRSDVAGQFSEGVTLAVSVEPTGGSPTGLPTGPVIASGKLQPA